MTEFSLHPDFVRDTIAVGKLPLCRVQLMNNQLFPWIILIPEVENAKEIIDLPETHRTQLLNEICQVSEVLKKALNPDKLNVAALGNVTPQLHVHVIARFTNDAAWPKPVWGHESKPYEPEQHIKLTTALRVLLGM